jgi:phosphate-selective porin
MRHPTCHRPRIYSIALATLSAAAVLETAAIADVVQGTVTPASAKVIIKDGAGNQVSELAGGPFQVRLPAGRFTAECQPPSQKKVQIFSLAQPTTVNIDCT